MYSCIRYRYKKDTGAGTGKWLEKYDLKIKKKNRQLAIVAPQYYRRRYDA